jgi:hypothetical protein
MLPEAVKARLKAAPFKPFDLRLTSGETYTIRHSELVSLSPGGRHLILWTGDNSYVDIDLLLVEHMSEAGGNGHRRKSA